MPESSVLKLEGVTAGYGSTVVLRNVCLEVPHSSVVALLGPNGAGKTSLLRVASGLITPTSGRIWFDGEDVSGHPMHKMARRGVCHIPEGRGVFPSLTVRENLTLFSAKGREADDLAWAVETFPNLGRRLPQKAGSLSGGEQQMLALVRSGTTRPRLVMVDEASMGLAPVMVDRVFEFMRTIAAQGTALLIVEQYIYRALDLAGTVYVLNQGEIVFSGTSEKASQGNIFRQYLGAEATIGDHPA